MSMNLQNLQNVGGREECAYHRLNMVPIGYIAASTARNLDLQTQSNEQGVNFCPMEEEDDTVE
jgi:hypothetical protein